jgi:hypothetical protein
MKTDFEGQEIIGLPSLGPHSGVEHRSPTTADGPGRPGAARGLGMERTGHAMERAWMTRCARR